MICCAQVMDYERLNEKLESAAVEAARELREAETAAGGEREEVRRARVAANEEKSGRIHLEAQLREVRRRVDEAEQVRGLYTFLCIRFLLFLLCIRFIRFILLLLLLLLLLQLHIYPPLSPFFQRPLLSVNILTDRR